MKEQKAVKGVMSQIQEVAVQKEAITTFLIQPAVEIKVLNLT
jgi:hypothetical protein